MSVVKIVQSGHPVLREKAKAVPLEDIPSRRIGKIVADMKKALAGEREGVAIAASQIGVSLRIFVVAGKVFVRERKGAGENEKKEEPPLPDKVFINPVITKKSRTKEEMWEGCLSVHAPSGRRLFGKIKRYIKTTVAAYDERGKKFTFGGSGLLAEIFQHEIDHLNGILFIDSAYDIEELPAEPEERKERVKKLRTVS